MSDAQAARFERALVEDFESIKTALSRVDVQATGNRGGLQSRPDSRFCAEGL